MEGDLAALYKQRNHAVRMQKQSQEELRLEDVTNLIECPAIPSSHTSKA